MSPHEPADVVLVDDRAPDPPSLGLVPGADHADELDGHGRSFVLATSAAAAVGVRAHRTRPGPLGGPAGPGHRFITDTWGWEIPAGAADPGEAIEDTARREAFEETGWAVGRLTYALALVQGHLGGIFGDSISDQLTWRSPVEVVDVSRLAAYSDDVIAMVGGLPGNLDSWWLIRLDVSVSGVGVRRTLPAASPGKLGCSPGGTVQRLGRRFDGRSRPHVYREPPVSQVPEMATTWRLGPLVVQELVKLDPRLGRVMEGTLQPVPARPSGIWMW